MEQMSNGQCTLHDVTKQQDTKMQLLPPSEAVSQVVDKGETCATGGCQNSSTCDSSAVEDAGVNVKRRRRKNRVRSMSVGEPNSSIFEDCHTAPLMCSRDDTLGGACRKNVRRKPLRQIGNLFGCFFRVRSESVESKEWTKDRALALLELSQRQQSALAVKEDTIAMLEWKLEQLQLRSDDPEAPVGSLAEKEGGQSGQDRISNPQGQENHATGDPVAIVHLFEMAAVKARLAVRFFCKVFMKQMEVSGYSVWRTLAEIEPTTKFSSKDHTAFILESRLNKALYQSFENDSFDETGLTRIIDSVKRCNVRFQDFQRLKLVEAAVAVNPQNKAFDAEFAKFCENKMREMWFLFPWNVVFKDSEERFSFTAAFLDAAKCVWLLHRLAFAVHPNVTILRVGKGMDANSSYVEQVAPVNEGCKKCDCPKVEFMSMPGFQIRNKLIKCQVYRHLQCK